MNSSIKRAESVDIEMRNRGVGRYRGHPQFQTVRTVIIGVIILAGWCDGVINDVHVW